MQKRTEVQYKNMVIKQANTWHLVNFIIKEGVLDGEPTHRAIHLEDENLFTIKELLFMDYNSPILTLSKSFYEMLDSPDEDTQEMARSIFVVNIKNHMKNYVKTKR